MEKIFKLKNKDIEVEISGYEKNDVLELLSVVLNTDISPIEHIEEKSTVVEEDTIYDVTTPSRSLGRIPNSYDVDGNAENNTFATGLTCCNCIQSFAFEDDTKYYFYLEGVWYSTEKSVSYKYISKLIDEDTTAIDAYNMMLVYIKDTEVLPMFKKLENGIEIYSRELTCLLCGTKDIDRNMALTFKIHELQDEGHCIVCGEQLNSNDYEYGKCSDCGTVINWVEE